MHSAALVPSRRSAWVSPTVTVVVEELEAGSDLDALFEASLAHMEAVLTDLQVIDVSAEELAGQPARRVLASFRQGIHALTLEQWYAVADGRLFVVSGTSATLGFPMAGPVILEIIRGIQPG